MISFQSTMYDCTRVKKSLVDRGVTASCKPTTVAVVRPRRARRHNLTTESTDARGSDVDYIHFIVTHKLIYRR
jgi:hypothetical protein